MKAIFLDRDGVINQERGDYTWKIEDWKFTVDIISFLQKTSKMGFKHIVITNQGGIAKGLYTHQDVKALHRYMQSELEKNGIEMLDVFYSPYHSDFSESLSRKPESLMFEKAIYIYGINVSTSVMIGDSQRDIVAAEKVGLKAFKVDANGPLNHIIDYLK